MMTDRKLRKRVRKLRKEMRRVSAQLEETRAHCKRLCDTVGALEAIMQPAAAQDQQSLLIERLQLQGHAN